MHCHRKMLKHRPWIIISNHYKYLTFIVTSSKVIYNWLQCDYNVKKIALKVHMKVKLFYLQIMIFLLQYCITFNSVLPISFNFLNYLLWLTHCCIFLNEHFVNKFVIQDLLLFGANSQFHIWNCDSCIWLLRINNFVTKTVTYQLKKFHP